MIRKLQIKFVAMCMILVTAVLGVVFTAVFFSAKQNIEVISHQDTSFLSNQPRANRTPPPKSSRFSPLAMVSCQGRTAFSPSSVNQALQESQTVTGWKQAIK